MTVDLRPRSPLEGLDLPVGLREVPFLAQVGLRVDPADADGRAAVEAVIGFPLPLRPNTASGRDGHRALWLGPDEWLLLAPPGSGPELVARLEAAAGDRFVVAIDVSANRTTLELWGPHARSALESACSIDLHPRAFGPDAVAQTVLGRAGIILGQLSDEPRYHVLVRPSFAAYVAAWLADALADASEDAPSG